MPWSSLPAGNLKEVTRGTCREEPLALSRGCNALSCVSKSAPIPVLAVAKCTLPFHILCGSQEKAVAHLQLQGHRWTGPQLWLGIWRSLGRKSWPLLPASKDSRGDGQRGLGPHRWPATSHGPPEGWLLDLKGPQASLPGSFTGIRLAWGSGGFRGISCISPLTGVFLSRLLPKQSLFLKERG